MPPFAIGYYGHEPSNERQFSSFASKHDSRRRPVILPWSLISEYSNLRSRLKSTRTASFYSRELTHILSIGVDHSPNVDYKNGLKVKTCLLNPANLRFCMTEYANIRAGSDERIRSGCLVFQYLPLRSPFNDKTQYD